MTKKTAAPPQTGEQTAPPPIKSRKPRQAKMGGPRFFIVSKDGARQGIRHCHNEGIAIQSLSGVWTAEAVEPMRAFAAATADGTPIVDLTNPDIT